jgi:dTDP-4-amino-4,6-dideoxygalactose transaminase
VGCFSLQFNKIITSGEGGMVITNNDEVWKRALMFHDVIGGLRNHLPDEEILWGINFRMPELLGAVMLVQLRRLEGLLTAMRVRKRMLLSGIADTAQRKGIRFQDIPDPEGDASIALIFFAETPNLARKIASALDAENIDTWQLYHPDHVDYHVFRHWTPIMNQRAWTKAGAPWQWARREIRYEADLCPRSLDLLGRAIHIDVNPLFTNQDIEETIDGINCVFEGVA